MMKQKKYSTLQVMGPEHEFAIIDQDLKALPISDKVIKKIHGRIVNNVQIGRCILGKELQSHVLEFKATEPFETPKVFEEVMYDAVIQILELLQQEFDASLLGTGMHPFLELSDARVWSHRDRRIYEAFDRIFDIHQHGWLNIQCYQLNLPFSNEQEGVILYNQIANILPYLPAVSASSPVYESRIGRYKDNRLHFYRINQKEVPSITGAVIPRYINSFDTYRRLTIEKYLSDLSKIGAPSFLMGDWVNSRGAIYRFDRKSIEIRIMDEQECIKSDVALSCFIRAILRGLMEDENCFRFELLNNDFNAIVKHGLDADVLYPNTSTAREVCWHLYKIARDYSTDEERDYLKIVRERIRYGSLSDLIVKQIKEKSKSKKTCSDALFSVYSSLSECLSNNKVFQ